MGIREAIEKNQGLATIAAAALILLCVGWIVFQQVSASSPGMIVQNGAYFTTDDGATFFVDDSSKVPAFDKDGQEAVGAHVFIVDGKETVLYLERYTDRGREALKEFDRRVKEAEAKIAELNTRDDTEASDYPVVPQRFGPPPGRELKVANDPDAEWIPGNSPEGLKLETEAAAQGRRKRPE